MNFVMRDPVLASLSVAALLLSPLGGVRADPGGFTGLGDLPGGDTESVALGVSAAGDYVVGYSKSANGTEAFRWSAAQGMVGLGDLDGGDFHSEAAAISADGRLVVGMTTGAHMKFSCIWPVARGTIARKPSIWGNLPGMGDEATTAVSADGSKAFGTAVVQGPVGFRLLFDKDPALGYLPSPNWYPPFSVSQRKDESLIPFVLNATSADGSVTAGSMEKRAFVLTEGEKPVLLGGTGESCAYGLSGDGSVAVGQMTTARGQEAFRWTRGGGMKPLGDFSGGAFESKARSVSGDGTIAVGYGVTSNGESAAVWVGNGPPQRVWEYAVKQDPGVASALTGWKLTRAAAISSDGKTIVGTGFNPQGRVEAWRLSLP